MVLRVLFEVDLGQHGTGDVDADVAQGLCRILGGTFDGITPFDHEHRLVGQQRHRRESVTLTSGADR